MDLRNVCFLQCGLCFALAGFMIFISGTMFVSTTTTLLNQIVFDEMALGGMPTGISTYKRFHEWSVQARDKPGGRQVTMYVFNLTNPGEVLTGSKPHVEEIGPFVYQHEWVRENFTWNEDGTKLGYHEHKRYHYIPSAQYPDDHAVKITTVRLAYLGMIGAGKKEVWDSGDYTLISAAHLAWRGVDGIPLEPVSMPKRFSETRTVNELAVGFVDSQLVAGHLLFPNKAPPNLPGPLFNGTIDKHLIPPLGNVTITPHNWYDEAFKVNTLYTGLNTEKSKENAYYLTERNGYNDSLLVCPGSNIPQNPCPCYSALPSANCDWTVKVQGASYGYTDGRMPWGTKEASAVTGADGINFPPFVQEDTTLKIWLDACARAIPMKKKGEKVIKGITTWKFSPDDAFWQDASKNPANNVYYMHRGDGVLNLTSVQHDAPIFATRPHFMGCDPKHREDVTGVSTPDPDIHDFEIDVEPVTGLCMGGAGRVQLNVRIGELQYTTSDPLSGGAIDYRTDFEDVKEALLPLMWVADGGAMTDAQADEWKGLLGAAIGLQSWLNWVLGFCGGIILVVGIVLCLVGGNCIKGGSAAFAGDKDETEGKSKAKLLVIASVILGLLLIAAVLGVLAGVGASLMKGMEAGEAEASLLQSSHQRMTALLREKASLLAELERLE